MKKVFYLALGIIVIAVLFGSCGSNNDVHPGATIDWGDGFYWDSSSESVQKTWNNWD